MKTQPWNLEAGSFGLADGRRLALLLGSCFLISALCFRASGQTYSIDWFKIAGGGGTSTGATYQVTGGFWSLISVVQMPGVPNLVISHSGSNVIVSWLDAATNSYTLQQNANLALTNGWATSGYTVTPANGTNSITITPPTGNLFFRLKQ